MQVEDHTVVEKLLQQNAITEYFILPNANGWVSLYEKVASTQNEARIQQILTLVSLNLQCVAICMLIHDDDILAYWLQDKGVAIDQFNSQPNYFGDFSDIMGEGMPQQDEQDYVGNPDKLLPYCVAGTDLSTLQRFFEKSTEGLASAGEIAEQLAAVLGINPERVISDYDYIEQDGMDELMEVDE
jgi:hypothetical protein